MVFSRVIVTPLNIIYILHYITSHYIILNYILYIIYYVLYIIYYILCIIYYILYIIFYVLYYIILYYIK